MTNDITSSSFAQGHNQSIIRQAHAKRFVCIENKLAQNNSLSLRARGLILYLLSLPDDWSIHFSQLLTQLKEGRTTLLTTMRELRRAGYVHLTKRGFQSSTQYFVFEAPTSAEEFKQFLQSVRFANSLQTCNYKVPIATDTDTKDTNKRVETEPIPEPIPEPPKPKREPSPEASGLCVFFLNKLKSAHEGFRQPNIKQWTRDLDLMLRIDKRDEAEVREVIEWVFAPERDEFWAVTVLSPRTLRKLYDRAIAKMRFVPKETGRGDPKVAMDNRRWADELLRSLDRSKITRDNGIRLCEDRAELISGSEITPLGYGASGFRDILSNRLRGWGLI